MKQYVLVVGFVILAGYLIVSHFMPKPVAPVQPPISQQQEDSVVEESQDNVQVLPPAEEEVRPLKIEKPVVVDKKPKELGQEDPNPAYEPRSQNTTMAI